MSGGNLAPPPEFGSTFNPIPTRGQIMPTTLLIASPPGPPGFENLTPSSRMTSSVHKIVSESSLLKKIPSNIGVLSKVQIL